MAAGGLLINLYILNIIFWWCLDQHIHCNSPFFSCYIYIYISIQFSIAVSLYPCEFLYLTTPAVDCGDPGTPTNGLRTLSSTTYNSVVSYTCDVGYTLQGSNSRTCQSNGQWKSRIPSCKRMLWD